MNSKIIAKRLKKLRGKKTQAEVAEACGITPQAYANYESGLRIPKDIHKIAIAKFFDTTVESLFFT